LHSGTVASCH